MPIKLSRYVLRLCFISMYITYTLSHKRCLVCKKIIDKKVDQKTPPSADVLLKCFGVTYSEDKPTQPVFICSTCLPNVFVHKKTGKTFNYISTLCFHVSNFTDFKTTKRVFSPKLSIISSKIVGKK